MFFKYLKLVLFLPVLLQASPKAFDSLGNDLESFQKDCHSYQKVSPLPKIIKKKCETFNIKLNSAFKEGYKLDPYIDNGSTSEKQLDKYLSLLRKLDATKENILELIYAEMKKARKESNIEYYNLLIADNKITLNLWDYEFMKKHKDKFDRHPQYIAHEKRLKSQEELRLKKAQVNNRQNKIKKHKITRKSKYSGLDKKAYNAYQRTKAYQTREKKVTTGLHASMNAASRENSSIIDWDVTLKSLEQQTGEWAILSAVAKGYHANFVYVLLSLSLRDKKGKEVYRSSEIKRKMYTNKQNYISQSQLFPKGLIFASATVKFDLDLEAKSYINQTGKVSNTRRRPTHQKNTSLLSQVDLINCSGYLKDNNPLKVTFFYKNRSRDKSIYWKNDVASITCMVYGDVGNWRNHIKGPLLGQISDKKVTHAFQDIYIDLRSTSFSHGILECSVNIYGRIFKTNDNFLMK